MDYCFLLRMTIHKLSPVVSGEVYRFFSVVGCFVNEIRLKCYFVLMLFDCHRLLIVHTLEPQHVC